jgi:hypothetical protein
MQNIRDTHNSHFKLPPWIKWKNWGLASLVTCGSISSRKCGSYELLYFGTILFYGLSRDVKCSYGYSPYCLLHGRETTLSNSDILKARVAKEIPELCRRIEILRTSLKLAYKLVAISNKQAHSKNNILYDCKAKLQAFEIAELVYL